MFIEKLYIRISTISRENWGRKIDFTNEDGSIKSINLIYGENEIGKTSILKSINYALGGEDIYGITKKNLTNLTAVQTDEINGEKLKSSKIFLQLINNNQRIIILRDALNRQAPIFVYRDIDIENILPETPVKYYKFEKDRNVVGNKTFNEFIMDFFQFPIYISKDIDEKERQIYFQNIMPLFFVPQRAWIDIQPTNPYYGVADYKKIAFQLLLNLSEVKTIEDKLKLQEKKAELREKEHTLKLVEDVVAVAEYKTLAEIDEQLGILENDILILKSELKNLEEKKISETDNYEPIENEYLELKSLIYKLESKSEILKKEIKQYDYYVSKINMDIMKADKLKTAKLLISNIPFTQCPHCYNHIDIDEDNEIANNQCDLCGNDLDRSNTPEITQLISYLKDERSDFEKLKGKKIEKKKEIEHILFYKQIRIKEIKRIVDKIEERLTPQFLSIYYTVSNKIGSKENRISSLEKEKNVVTTYNDLQISINNLRIEVKGIERRIKEKINEGEDEKKLKLFEGKFKSFLREIDFLKYENKNSQKEKKIDESYFSQLYIDRDYKPKIKDLNLYNLTSESGLIRVFNAYYLALLYTSLIFDTKTNHPNILILDEPRQQNLDLDSFFKLTDLYKKIAKEFPNKFQIIFASGDKGAIEDDKVTLELSEDNYAIIRLD